MELVIYTDESDKYGKYYSNFYGGVLVRSTDLEGVIGRLEACKFSQNLFNEVKWQKVTRNYLDKYMTLMDAFFDEVQDNLVKVRIMFTHNQYVPKGLSADQRRSAYHMLYYQFLKHAFGLQYATEGIDSTVRVRINLDQMPTNSELSDQFKSYLVGLNRNTQMRQARVRFDREQIAEVSSHDHVLLQCADVVLGAMSFRLNDKHKLKPAGQRVRGSKTIAKEELYKQINQRIRRIYANFNVGITTGTGGDARNRWHHPYRHWSLIPKNHKRDMSKTKQ